MFITRLDELLAKRLGNAASQKQKAELCGIQYEFFRQIMNQTRNPPSDDKIMDAAKNLQLSERDAAELLILAAKDRAKGAEAKGILERVLDPEFFNATDKQDVMWIKEEHIIPIYTSIKAGDGEMHGEICGEIQIDSEHKTQRVFAIRVSGDSMANDLFSGEIALFVPVGKESANDNDIYAVEVEGWASWVIKYIKYDPSGMVQLISANSAFPVKEIDPKVSRVTLRGKLVESRRFRK